MAKKEFKDFDITSNPLKELITPKKVVSFTQEDEKKENQSEETKTVDQTPEPETDQVLAQGQGSSKDNESSSSQEEVETSSASATTAGTLSGVKQVRTKKSVVRPGRVLKNLVTDEQTPVVLGRKVSKLPAATKSYHLGEWCDRLFILMRNEKRKQGEFEINTRDIIEMAAECLAKEMKMKEVPGTYPRPQLKE